MNYREVSEASRAAYFKAKAELNRHLPVLSFFAGWNAAKYQFADAEDVKSADAMPQPYSDLYLWLDSVIHEALPSNYETLSPQELREHLASALFDRLSDDSEFQALYSKHIFGGTKAVRNGSLHQWPCGCVTEGSRLVQQCDKCLTEQGGV